MTKILTSLLISAVALFALDINTASVEDFEKIKGISKEKAEAIVKYRNENGKFKNVNELKNVKGIGDKSVENIKNDVLDKSAKNTEKKVKKESKKAEKDIKETTQKAKKSAKKVVE